MIAYIATDAFGDFVAKNGYARSLMYSRKDKIDHIEAGIVFADDHSKDEYDIEIQQGAEGRLFISKERIRCSVGKLEEPYERCFSGAGTKSALIDYSSTDETARVVNGVLKGCRVFHFNDTSFNSRMRMPGYVQDDRYLRSDGGNLAAYLYRLKTEIQLKKYYERITDVVREVLPRFDRFFLHPRTFGGGDERISLNWKEKGCEDIFGPHMLSDGTLRFIALTTLLLRPKNEYSDIVILDEPEIGLHPFAVRILSEMMKMASGDSQIIVATQSRELLNSFSADDTIVAEFDPVTESSILKRLNGDMLEDWLREYSLAELWDKNIIGGNV